MCVDIGEKERLGEPLGGRGCLECGDELLDVCAGLGKSLMLFCDAAAGMEHGRMVTTAKELANFDERARSVMAKEVHRNVASVCDVT